MKIELIHPPHPTATDDKLDAPLGLLYLAASIKNSSCGWEVSVKDLSGLGMDKKKWNIEPADIYGITSYICTMELAVEIAKHCWRINSEAKIIGGGANLTGIIESGRMDLISNIYDSIVVGDGELAIMDIIYDYPKLKKTYNHPLEKNLDRYPDPDYTAIDIHSYHRKISGLESVTILTSRGCPFHCAFCGLPKQRRIVRYRSPRSVANEILFIKEKYGIRAFNFQDDTFLVDKERVYKLMDLIGPLDIKFRCLGRVGLDTKEDYKRLKDAGCQQISWGIESGSQFVLDRMRKMVTVAQNKEVISWVQDLKMLDRIFLVIGFPGETWETLEETKAFIEETNPSQYIASTFQPYPGTDVCNNPSKYGITRIYRDFKKYIQVNGDGLGGECNVDSIFMNRQEMMDAQKEFRKWLDNRRMRGPLLDYELDLEIKRDRRAYMRIGCPDRLKKQGKE